MRRFVFLVGGARGPRHKYRASLCTMAYVCEWFNIKTRSRKFAIRMPRVIICVDTARRDIVGFWEIWCEREYAPGPEFEPKDGEMVFDVGANVGFYSLFHAVDHRNTRVFAFEPEPESHGRLVENLAANNIENVEVHQVAVSDVPGTLWLSSSRMSLVTHVVEAGDEGAVSVECTTLDRAVEANGILSIDSLKIDCEGHELPVLRGGLGRALPVTKRIALEYHSTDDRIEIINLLNHIGFILKYELNSTLFFARPTSS